MISAEQFLAVLQEKDLLPADLIQRVRRQLQQAEQPPTVAVLAEQLIGEGFLTPVLVKRLVEQATAAAAADHGHAAVPEPDELGLAPLDDEPGTQWGAKAPAKAAEPEEHAQQPPADAPKHSAASSLLEAELEPLGAAGGTARGPLDRLMADPLLGGAAGGLPLGPPRSGRTSWRRLLRTWFRGLFQRRDVVEVKPVDPQKIKLLVIAWGAGVLLIVGGLVATSYLLPLTAEETWQAAQDAYFAGNYPHAVEQYKSFLQRFPQEQRASQVRVRLALARIQLAAQQPDGAVAALAALRVAKEVVPKIAAEDTFEASDATRRELALMLVDIAEELSRQVPRHPEQSLGRQARAALGLMEHNIPAQFRPTVRVAEVAALLTAAENQVGRYNQLDGAVADIGRAVGRGDLASAYASYDALLGDYPDLAGNERLEKAMDGVSRAEQAKVKVVPQVRLPQGELAVPGLSATVVLVTGETAATGGEAAGAGGHVVVALCGGAAYGVDAATGKVCWRRLLGRPSSSPVAPFLPQPIGPAAGSDVLLVDPVRQEVWRVAGESGRILWRFPLGEPPRSPPVVAGNLVLAATPSGRLVMIDLETGHSSAYVQLPQPLYVAPAYDPLRSLVFQVADRGQLYVISLPEGRCRQVVHLGHRPGAVAVPPVVAGDFLVVAENEGVKEFKLRALSLGAFKPSQPETIVQPVEQIRLRGRVTSPMAVEGPRVLAATAEGMLYGFDLVGGKAAAPLQKIAEYPLTGVETPRRFAVLQGDHVWVADTKLARYQIRPAAGRLALDGIADPRSIFLQPPVLLGTTVVNVWTTGGPGVFISAREDTRRVPTWQVRVAAPWPAEPLLSGAAGKLAAVTALGAMFQFDVGGLPAWSVLDRPLLAPARGELPSPIGRVVAMPGGMFAMIPDGESNQIVLFDPQEPRQFRWLLLPESVLACPPIAMAGGLLAPCKNGRIFLLDPHSTEVLAEPFEPELKSLSPWTWREPAAVDHQEAVVCDGDKRLYLLASVAEAGEKPRLLARSEAVVRRAIASGVAVAGNVVYVVDVAGTLRSFQLPLLEEGKTYELDGSCVWGPRGFGRRALLATGKGRLLCMGDRQNLLWQIELRYGPLAGTPWDTGKQFILASRGGVVWRVDASTGEESGKVETGCPLATGVVEVAGRFFVGSPDGCVYEVTL